MERIEEKEKVIDAKERGREKGLDARYTKKGRGEGRGEKTEREIEIVQELKSN